MDVTAKRVDMLRAVHLGQGVAERRSTVPILSNVLVAARKGALLFTTTDLEVGVRSRCEGDVHQGGEVTVNARKLYEVLRESAGEEVSLRTAGSGWLEVVAGKSRFRMVTLDPKDFPPVPLGVRERSDGASLRVGSALLREMIAKTLFAVSTDDTRFNLGGVFLETPEVGCLRMVATDGHRLAMVDRKVKGAQLERGVLMPRKGVVEMQRLLEEGEEGEVELVVGDKDIRCSTSEVDFFMRLLEAEFPDYRQVIPRESRGVLRVGRDELLAALRRVSLLSSERLKGVRLQLEGGRLELSTSSPELGEATEELEVTYGGAGLTVGFNARYLMDVLGVQGEGGTVEFALTDDVAAGVVREEGDPGYCYVVMPMRL